MPLGHFYLSLDPDSATFCVALSKSLHSRQLTVTLMKLPLLAGFVTVELNTRSTGSSISPSPAISQPGKKRRHVESSVALPLCDQYRSKPCLMPTKHPRIVVLNCKIGQKPILKPCAPTQRAHPPRHLASFPPPHLISWLMASSCSCSIMARVWASEWPPGETTST